jgi:hypothetical protein
MSSKEVYRLLGQIALERGKGAESRVENALNRASNDLNIIIPDWFLGHEPATEIDDKRRKTDHWISTDVGRIRLQVKSSKNSADTFHEKHPNIPVIFVQAGDDDCVVLGRIFSAVGKQREIYLQKRNGWHEEHI